MKPLIITGAIVGLLLIVITLVRQAAGGDDDGAAKRPAVPVKTIEAEISRRQTDRKALAEILAREPAVGEGSSPAARERAQALKARITSLDIEIELLRRQLGGAASPAKP